MADLLAYQQWTDLLAGLLSSLLATHPQIRASVEAQARQWGVARVSGHPAAAHPLARLCQRPGGVWSDAVPPDPTAEITARYGRLLQAIPEHLRGAVEATLGALVRRHRRHTAGPWCTGCHRDWPCLDSAILAAGLAPPTEETEDAPAGP